jgi:hypothetical protein
LQTRTIGLVSCRLAQSLKEGLKLNSLANGKWFVTSGSIEKDEGIDEAFELFEDI